MYCLLFPGVREWGVYVSGEENHTLSLIRNHPVSLEPWVPPLSQARGPFSQGLCFGGDVLGLLWNTSPPGKGVSGAKGTCPLGPCALPVKTLCPALLIFAPSIWSPEFPAPLALHPPPGLHEPHPWAVLPRESHASWSHSWALSKSEQGADVCRGVDRAQMQGSGCPHGECKALYCAGWSQLSKIRGQDRHCCHLSPCHWA